MHGYAILVHLVATAKFDPTNIIPVFIIISTRSQTLLLRFCYNYSLTMGEGLFYLVVLIWLTQGRATPLDDYVNRPDPTYGYKILKKVQEATHTMYALNMTSQTWKPGEYHLSLLSLSFSPFPLIRISLPFKIILQSSTRATLMGKQLDQLQTGPPF